MRDYRLNPECRVENLEAEVKRLRALGDALAEAVETWVETGVSLDAQDALGAWRVGRGGTVGNGHGTKCFACRMGLPWPCRCQPVPR